MSPPLRAHVRVRTADGALHDLGPGDLIGRLPGAALCLDDAGISEAHAYVSLRGEVLKLLALRGLFAVGGRPVEEVVLRPGLQIALSHTVQLLVEAVSLPAEVLAIQGPDLPRQVLAGTTSIVTRPRVSLVSRFVGEASAHIWTTGGAWRLRVGGGEARPLQAGQSFEVDGHALSAVSISLASAGPSATHVAQAVGGPLTVEARFDSVHLSRAGAPPLVLTGNVARLVSELVAVDGPAGWELVASEVWGQGVERGRLRRRLDATLGRLRKQLEEARIRTDLVRPDGCGNLELLTYAGDRVVDRT